MGWLDQLRSIWYRLPGPQRIFLIGVTAAIIIIVSLVGAWAGRQEYAVLYAELEAESAASIVDQLRSQNVKYKLSDGGRTIRVPKSDVYDARLRLASSGLPHAGGEGYEILDTNKMGWTDFVQKLQYRRALEGEISRTIQALDEIAHARVHIVIPEPTLFQEDEKPTTASVVVKLHGGARLGEPRVQGIVHLVSAAVEGLEPDHVTVLDTRGRLLSSPADETGLLGATSNQIYLTRTVEENLVRKAQTALEQVLGPHKAVVRVSAELDFESTETTQELFDAENPVVRSEQRSEQTSADAGTSEESTTNYEVSKTIKRSVDSPGKVKRISTSVFVDGTYDVSDTGERQYVPRTPAEMQKLTTLLQAAIGFDRDRGDQLSVENIAFDDTEMQRTMQEMEKSQRLEMIQKIGGVAVSLLLAVGALLVLMRLFRRTVVSGAGVGGAATTLQVDEDMGEMPAVRKDIRQLKLERKVEEISKQPPEEIVRIIRAWMYES